MITDSPLSPDQLHIGWAQVDITPDQLPVKITGQFPTRISEGVKDNLTATACVFANTEEQAVFVSCDLIAISEPLYKAVRDQLVRTAPAIDPDKVILHATHTHTAPDIRGDESIGSDANLGITDLDRVYSAEQTVTWIAAKIVSAISSAWDRRTPGSVAYGMDDAVVGRNRRWVNDTGISTMYGLKSAAAKDSFRHIEGYEDHSLNLIATYDAHGQLTGLLLNLPCPSQEEENGCMLSADFWHETRQELRNRWGNLLYILPQVSAAGELTSHPIFEKEARLRMLRLRNHDARHEIALRIAHAVDRILPVISDAQATAPLFKHTTSVLHLPVNSLTAADAASAEQEADQLQQVYTEELEKLKLNPELKAAPRWYLKLSAAYRRMQWHRNVVKRYELQKTCKTLPAEVHTVRIGEIALASNPFEYYLDFGTQIKVRSPAIQTFIVQLAGPGTYVPSHRSVIGGGYGSVPASNPIGPEGGQVLADYTVSALNQLFAVPPADTCAALTDTPS